MRCRAAPLPLLLACLFGARPALGQFNNILHKVTSEIQKAKPKNIEDVLKSTSTNDIVSAIKDKQKQVSRDDAMKVVGSVKDAVKDVAGGGVRGGAPVEVTTTTLPPGSQTAHVAEALRGTSFERIAGNLRDALQDATPKELAGKIQGAVGKPKALADQILGKDTAHFANALQDATAKEVIAAVKDGAGSASQDAAKKAAEGARETVAGLDAKGMLDAIKGADVDKVKDLADTKLDQYKDALKGTDVHTINDAVKNPSVDKLNKAIDNVRGIARRPAPEPGDEDRDGQGVDIDNETSSSGTLVVLLLLALVVFGGLYTFRRLTKPRPVGLPMLEGESFDMHPMNPMSGSFFGGSGARDLQPQGTASNGFTRF